MGMFLFLRRLLSVVYLMTHPAVPMRLKVLPILAFIYLAFPRDLWFDFRAFGFLDDFIVGGLLIGTFVNKGWTRVQAAQKQRDDTIPAEFRVIDEDGNPPSSEDASSDEGVSSGDDAPPTDGEPSAPSDPHDTDGAPTSDIRG